MGYLLKMFYHPKINNKEFKFDTDIKKEKTYKIGKKEEDIETSKLASVIMQQLSRRDILVCDIEVQQFVKKTIKIKEIKNGIIIGNEKFVFNDSLLQETQGVEIEDLDEKRIIKQNQQDQDNENTQSKQKPKQETISFIKEEYFEPNPSHINLKDRFKNHGLTIGKKYKIVQEIGPARDMVTHYMVINDLNKIIRVPISFFSAIPAIEQKEQSPYTDLVYPGEVKDDTIHLRPELNQRKII